MIFYLKNNMFYLKNFISIINYLFSPWNYHTTQIITKLPTIFSIIVCDFSLWGTKSDTYLQHNKVVQKGPNYSPIFCLKDAFSIFEEEDDSVDGTVLSEFQVIFISTVLVIP